VRLHASYVIAVKTQAQVTLLPEHVYTRDRFAFTFSVRWTRVADSAALILEAAQVPSEPWQGGKVFT